MTMRSRHGDNAVRRGADRALGPRASRSSRLPTRTARFDGWDGFSRDVARGALGAATTPRRSRSRTTIWRAAPRGDRRLTLWVHGSNFQLQVWRALLAAGSDSTVSYARLARDRSGAASACRAVGSAVGANPVAWLIPCHHVLRANGALGGYRWGLERKRAMLAWEVARSRQGRFSSSSFGFSRFGRSALSIDSCILASASRFWRVRSAIGRERRVRDDLRDLRLQRCPAGAGTSRRSSRGSSRGSPASSCRRSG